MAVNRRKSQQEGESLANEEVIIVGAGLAGLSCALQLQESGVACRVLEAADQVGGRVRTDRLDGFQLDRGFQVLLTAYPETRRQLDYPRLHLGKFEPGALIRWGGKLHRFVDPWRRPQHLVSAALSPVATLMDKLRVVSLRRRVCRGSLEAIYERPESTTAEALEQMGFSPRIIERFFRPFLGGVFLDSSLETSSRMFEFVFRMFASGDAALPAEGMGAIPAQLANRLSPGTLMMQHRVESVDQRSVRLEDGTIFEGASVVVACEQPAANRLLSKPPGIPGRSATCLYYRADQPPVNEPILVLNGEGDGPINNLCVPNLVTPAYAVADQSLVSVTVLDPPTEKGESSETDEATVRSQLRNWFGSSVDGWNHLKTYNITYALPDQTPPALTPVVKPVHGDDGIVVCGDYCDTASIQGALISGRRAASAIHSGQRR